MSPRTGRPHSSNPKNIQVKFLADKQTMVDLDRCCEKLKLTRSEIIRLGIQQIKESLEDK